MKLETKSGVEIKQLDDEGTGIARIAMLSAVDSDGDTYLPGAFGEQHVKVLPAHNRLSVPLGRARVFERADEALAEFKLNLATETGREWHAALKFDFDSGRPLQEWSYGFRILDSAVETRDGERVRILKRLDVHEISPVVKGAGVGAVTLALKADATLEEKLGPALAAVARRVEAGEPATEEELRALHAYKTAVDALLEQAEAPARTARQEAARFERFLAGKHLPADS